MAKAIDKQTMLDLIIEAKRMDPETGSFSEWLAEYLVEHLATLTPPNEAPPCYQPDGDGCVYQCYDGDDEPIDKCKECPLCYSDKQRHHTPPNEWVSVEERLPEDEARQYIEDDLDGIGYLYPCLLTYKSPNTERIHVVRFYYDIIQKRFVNNGEELCEKGRCIAWMPLPAPYDRRSPEGEA